MLIACMVAIAFVPDAASRPDGGRSARTERAAPATIVLAQRCITYEGQLQCF